MTNLLELAINSCINSEISYCKSISPTDAGTTGSHQAGFHISKSAYRLLFDTPGLKGENKDKDVTIKWQNNFETESRFIYYGKATRNEYRITRFGRSFPYLNDDNVGNLFILAKKDELNFEAFVLSTEQEIESFFSYFGMSPVETNRLIDTSNGQSTLSSSDILNRLFEEYVNNLAVEFPSTVEISRVSRTIYGTLKGVTLEDDDDLMNNPDRELLNWLEMEYDLFKAIENDRYQNFINQPLKSVNSLIKISNTILNRRKSRAGRSLENHLLEMFTLHQLDFTHQPVTEKKKKPDFLFPGQQYYFNDEYKDKMVVLAAKTTCKDRWRQILNEADRIEQKHLFTLQQGISKNQLEEMFDANVVLIVPKDNISYYPPKYRDEILSLNDFISFTREKCTC